MGRLHMMYSEEDLLISAISICLGVLFIFIITGTIWESLVKKLMMDFFLGYSPMDKAFRVFNIRRQEMEETVHVTFSKDDEAISQSSTEGDAINFNENRSFPDDEYLEPRSEVNQCPGNTEYFPYIHAYENTTPTKSPILQVSVTSEDSPELTKADNHPALHEPDQTESADHLEPVEPQNNVIIKPISDVQPLPTILPSAEGYNQQNEIDYEETFAPVTRLEAIRIFLAYAAYMGFIVYQMDVKSSFLNGKISEEVYVQQPPRFESSEFPNHVCKLDKALYGLKQAPKACEMPYVSPNNLGPDESGVSVNETLFRGIIRSLMYLTASRPDIQFSTCLCARYQANPKESYLVAVKRIFRYLKGTPNLGFWYPKGSGFDLKAYSNSDYARCNLDRKSTSGGCQILGGKLVCWSAKKQSSVAMSSAEAEYVAASGCCAQVLWIKSQLADYDVLYDKVPIFCDNTSIIAISNNLVLHYRTKHIDISYHFIIDHILKGDIELHFVPTDLQLADSFTKPLAELSFTRLVAELDSIIGFNNAVALLEHTNEVEEETKTITFSLSWCNKPLSFTQDEFISAIGLPICKEVVPLPPKETDQMNLNQQIIAYCLIWGLNQQTIAYCLIWGLKIDIGAIIFSDLVHKLQNRKKNRETNICYTRFLSLIFEKLLGVNYISNDLTLVKPHTITIASFKKPLAYEVPLTSYMLKVAKLSEEPEQSVIPPPREVNADDIADKSLSKASVQPVTQPKALTNLKEKKKRIPPSSKPKSPYKVRVILPKKPVTEAQHAEVTVVTADATKSLVASELAEEQVNQPSAAEAEKVLDQNVEKDVKDVGFVAMEEVTFEQIMDEVDSKSQGSQVIAESPYDTELEIKIIKSYQAATISGLLFIHQNSSYDQEDQEEIDITPKDAEEGDAFDSLSSLRSMPDDDLASLTGFKTQDSTDHVFEEGTETLHAFADKPAQSDPLDHLHEELCLLYNKVNELESNIIKHVSNSIQATMPIIMTNTLKEQLPGLLSDALKDTLPRLIKDSIKSSVSTSIAEELPQVEAQRFVLLQKELSTSLHNKVRKSIKLKDLRIMFKDMVSLLEVAEVFKKANAEGEKWEKNNPESTAEEKDAQHPDQSKEEQDSGATIVAISLLEDTKKETNDEPSAKKLKFLIPPSSIPSPTPLKSIMPEPPKPTPPRDESKGKGIATEESLKDIMPFMEEGGSVLKISSLKSFTQEMAEHEAKRQKMLDEFNHQISFRADQLPITKISYVVNPNKEATMKITRGDNPLNLIVHPNFRLKMLGFSEWLEWVIDQAKKLGLPTPPALATFRMTAEYKKRKRTEFLKEVFVTENIIVDAMQRNLIPPPKVVPIEGFVINEPELGIFFMNRNTDIAFQRETEFHLTPIVQLIRIQKQIKVDS
ncbi:retrovirus-related pol polyprotein from transposon TNT 1-94 [Tanacetum coccineum]|uniref:Retrovirus-related pol polyprotein from transposon TNT 1-94 n=1 Tax=Tanacetum coccineum TaxID=301880 RepID=A0ABQ4XA88_9ASTR